MADAHPSPTIPAHFLIAGDSTDLPLLERLLSRLPVDAYGQVFIEIAAAFQRVDLPAPPGLTVTWLVADSSPLSHPRGELAAAAVGAWAEEWMPEERDAHTAPYVMWIGCATSAVMDRLYDHLGDRLDHLHLHHRHHD